MGATQGMWWFVLVLLGSSMNAMGRRSEEVIFDTAPLESEFAFLQKSEDGSGAFLRGDVDGVIRDMMRVFNARSGDGCTLVATLVDDSESDEHKENIEESLKDLVVRLSNDDLDRIVRHEDPELIDVIALGFQTPDGVEVPVIEEVEVLGDLGVVFVDVNPSTYVLYRKIPDLFDEILSTYEKMILNLFNYKYTTTVQTDQKAKFYGNPESGHPMPGFPRPMPYVSRQPDDEYYERQYGPEQMNCPEVWAKVVGKKNPPVIGIIDTGLDVSHPDLEGNVWKNPFGNDDPLCPGSTNGCYFPGGTRQPTGDISDSHGHGTHVAGTIGAIGNNGEGVCGVLWDAKLIGVKGNWLSSIVKAFLWLATIHGVKVSNNSWGFGGQVPALKHTLNALNKTAGHVAFFAASNEGQDFSKDPTGSWPQVYVNDLENLVNVAASTKSGKRASFSNYGVGWVQVAAPGHQIFSTWPLSKRASPRGYRTLSGTSMACPHAVGVAGLLMAAYPSVYNLTPKQFLRILYEGAVMTRDWKGLIDYGLLDAHKIFRIGGILDDFIGSKVAKMEPLEVEEEVIMPFQEDLGMMAQDTLHMGVAMMEEKEEMHDFVGGAQTLYDVMQPDVVHDEFEVTEEAEAASAILSAFVNYDNYETLEEPVREKPIGVEHLKEIPIIEANVVEEHVDEDAAAVQILYDFAEHMADMEKAELFEVEAFDEEAAAADIMSAFVDLPSLDDVEDTGHISEAEHAGMDILQMFAHLS